MKSKKHNIQKNGLATLSKTLITTIVLGLLLTSCSIFSSLNSNTSIKPNESFYLGNNPHGKFKVKLKNVSNHPIDIYFAPIDGGTYSRQTLQINEEIITKVPKNTAIVIENKSDQYASVDIKATGDLGLAMDYKN
jgi:hypothetical protein